MHRLIVHHDLRFGFFLLKRNLECGFLMALAPVFLMPSVRCFVPLTFMSFTRNLFKQETITNKFSSSFFSQKSGYVLSVPDLYEFQYLLTLAIVERIPNNDRSKFYLLCCHIWERGWAESEIVVRTPLQCTFSSTLLLKVTLFSLYAVNRPAAKIFSCEMCLTDLLLAVTHDCFSDDGASC